MFWEIYLQFHTQKFWKHNMNYSYPEQMLGADVSSSLSIFYGISLIISLNSCTNSNSIVILLFFLLLE